jgi:hypothetical protein
MGAWLAALIDEGFDATQARAKVQAMQEAGKFSAMLAKSESKSE